MPNINIMVDEDTLYKFRELKLKFKCKNNLDLLKRLIHIGEEYAKE